ncbi:hypothetical protein L1987_31893 [Smallanthus sonchifolius]|uniref:Uncharacterized protein n=1 Tax=Smallanthus sonchifolius TaxID=185202 RepID=A0ACB9I7F9_9ASTR|nr:hypothetical protein L1987_31893 [Smallanthus sonchifolius]
MDSSCQQKQHTNVLLVTLPTQGLINPILRLGKTLVSKGLHVKLATTDSALKNLSSPPNSIDGVHLEFFSDGLPIDYNRNADPDYYMNMLTKFGSINLSALIRSHAYKFACIIHTPFAPWVSDVAADMNIPNAMLWIQPCTIYQIYHRYYNHLNDFPTETNLNMTVNLPGLPAFTADDLPSFVLPSNTLRNFDIILNQVFTNLHKVKWVLGNSFMELENDVIVSLNNDGHVFLPVGPIVSATIFGKGFDLFKSNEKSDCIEWLNKQKPSSVVYISFGSLLVLSEKEIESIAAGLKSTKRPFLWVVRLPENQKLPELGVLEEIKEQGLIVSWSPQPEVLSHPSVGCFLSHCGWNSLVESLAAGVPVIACPQWTDQPTNAKLVADVWGVGVKVKKGAEGVISGEEVIRCVEEVMSGPRSEEIRKNVLELKAAAREALRDGGSSDNNIQIFVNEVVSSCSSYSEQK